MRPLALAIPLLFTACGGNVVFQDGSGGAGSTAASLVDDGAPPDTIAVTSTSSGTTACDGLPWGVCAGQPGCVPVFDDACCPTCTPGACGDCVDYRFVRCAPADEACMGALACGTPDRFVCDGTPHSCDSSGPCHFQLGCETFVCALDGPPCPDQCLEIYAGICEASCNALPPSCPDGYAPASDGFCWTGYCVPFEVCAIPL